MTALNLDRQIEGLYLAALSLDNDVLWTEIISSADCDIFYTVTAERDKHVRLLDADDDAVRAVGKVIREQARLCFDNVVTQQSNAAIAKILYRVMQRRRSNDAVNYAQGLANRLARFPEWLRRLDEAQFISVQHMVLDEAGRRGHP